MIINSDFKDYYDLAAKTGVDKTVVYNRRQKEIGRSDRPYRIKLKNAWLNYYDQAIGFCGKFYPFTTIYNPEPEYIFSFEDFKQFLKVHPPERYKFSVESLFSEKSYFKWKCIKSFDAGYWNPKEKLFIKYKCPIILMNGSSVILNPELRKYSFFRIKDTYTAYQEIMGYLSGILGMPARDTVSISDRDQAIKKGFDKWSFRKKVR